MSDGAYIGGPVWTCQKAGGRIIVMAGEREYRGVRFFEIREWVVAPDGTLAPTGKGATFPIDRVGDCQEALRAWDTRRRPPPALRAVD